MATPQKWQTRSSKYLVNDRWLKLRADSCVTPDGHIIEPYYVFEYSDYINCLAIDTNGDAIMLRHYRHGIKNEVLEVIGGGIDSADASPRAAITRELQEEIGYQGGKIYETGVSFVNPANHTNKIYSFLAVGGSCTAALDREAGETMRTERMPFAKLVALVNDPNPAEIYQSFHLACIFFAFNFIKRSANKQLQDLKQFLD